MWGAGSALSSPALYCVVERDRKEDESKTHEYLKNVRVYVSTPNEHRTQTHKHSRTHKNENDDLKTFASQEINDNRTLRR